MSPERNETAGWCRGIGLLVAFVGTCLWAGALGAAFGWAVGLGVGAAMCFGWATALYAIAAKIE